MKHVDKLVIGALLKAVKTSYFRTIKRWLLLAFVAHSSRIAAEHGMLKAKGFWVTLDTPVQSIRVFAVDC